MKICEENTKEPQYQDHLETFLKEGPIRLGIMTSNTWRTDPKRLLFLLSRYKFVSKMLTGYRKVLEVGCGDGFGSKLISQNGIDILCTDFDPVFIEEAKNREKIDTNREFVVADFLKDGLSKSGRIFEAAYLLDVIEHIDPLKEDRFLMNICRVLESDGVCVIGAPSFESQAFASPASREGHVNCKSGEEMRKKLKKYFRHIFMFSMNDEVVHTGFFPMAHYLLAVCVGVKGNS